MQSEVSKSMLARIPLYLHYLKELPNDSNQTISATHIAHDLGLGEVQVRKDLGFISGAGRPRIGYVVSELINNLSEYIKGKNSISFIIVGKKSFATALKELDGFMTYGIQTDNFYTYESDELLVNDYEEMKKFQELCQSKNIKVGILSGCSRYAQAICNLMIHAGIKAIWNFTSVRLSNCEQVLVKNENLASSLAFLAMQVSSE